MPSRLRIIPLLAVGLLLLGCASDEPADPTPMAAAEAAPPVSQPVETGQIQAEGQLKPATSVTLAFEQGGQVAEVLAREGQPVVAGEALLRLDDRAATAALAGAEAGLAASQAGLAVAEAQATLAMAQRKTAEAGLAAAEAELGLAKAGARPEQRAAAERAVAAAEAGVARAAADRDAALAVSDARVRTAEAQLATALSQLTALQETYDTILTTCVELPDGSEVCPGLGATEESVRAQIAAAEAGYNAAQLALAEAQAGATDAQRRAASADVAAAAAQRDVAAAQLALLDAGALPERIKLAEIGVEQARLGVDQADVAAEQAAAAVAQAEAGVLRAEADALAAQNVVDRLTLSAPFAGTVGEVLVQVGELVAPGMTVTQLASGSGWIVETTDLVELDVVWLDIGQAADVTLDAIPGQTLRGRIVDIGRVPQDSRGDVTYPVTVALDDYSDLPLRWGMTALVTIETP